MPDWCIGLVSGQSVIVDRTNNEIKKRKLVFIAQIYIGEEGKHIIYSLTYTWWFSVS